VHGWAVAHAGGLADGLVEFQTGMEASTRLWGKVALPHFIAMLAELLMLQGDHARALDEIEQILIANDTTRDLYFNAELHRLAGECHARFGEYDAAETALQRAIATARGQEAKTFELRAATALGRVWVNGRGEKAKAQALVRSTLEGLTDPEETVDVQRARSCLSDWS
jgi:predicted ATPase